MLKIQRYLYCTDSCSNKSTKQKNEFIHIQTQFMMMTSNSNDHNDDDGGSIGCCYGGEYIYILLRYIFWCVRKMSNGYV